MNEQMKLCSVPNKTGFTHDQDPEEYTDKKLRKKISEKEKKKRGDFIAEKSKDGVKKILENIHKKDINLLDRLRVKNWK